MLVKTLATLGIVFAWLVLNGVHLFFSVLGGKDAEARWAIFVTLATGMTALGILYYIWSQP